MGKIGKIGPIIIFLCLILAYSVYETTHLSISRFYFPAPNSPPLKIALITDLHLHKMGLLEKKLKQTLNREQPDLILIAGDTLDSDLSISIAKELFNQLKPKFGILATLGNWENWKGLNTASLFQSFGVRLLKNELFDFENGISILGLDDLTGIVDSEVTQKVSNKNFCIALVHSPMMFENVSSVCPLVLAGHTHGGQIRIPFLKPLWLPKGSGNYISGWYTQNDAKLYVSRGIGTSILPFRFLSSPELVLITLKTNL